MCWRSFHYQHPRLAAEDSPRRRKRRCAKIPTCQYPVQLAPLAPQWLRICAEKQLGKYSTVPPNLVAQFDGQAVPNASLISLSTEYGRKYADANAEAYRLWNLHHAEVMSDCNQSYHKTDTGDGADVRGCPNDLITALFIIVSKHEERGWTDRHARESMYINSPDYLATCKKVETFIKVMQKPMMESIRLKVRIPFSVCIKIAKGLQRRDNAFVDLATRYNLMPCRRCTVCSVKLAPLHGLPESPHCGTKLPRVQRMSLQGTLNFELQP